MLYSTYITVQFSPGQGRDDQVYWHHWTYILYTAGRTHLSAGHLFQISGLGMAPAAHASFPVSWTCLVGSPSVQQSNNQWSLAGTSLASCTRHPAPLLLVSLYSCLLRSHWPACTPRNASPDCWIEFFYLFLQILYKFVYFKISFISKYYNWMFYEFAHLMISGQHDSVRMSSYFESLAGWCLQIDNNIFWQCQYCCSPLVHSP